MDNNCALIKLNNNYYRFQLKNNILLSEEYDTEKIIKSMEYKNYINTFFASKDKNNNIYIIYNDFDGNIILDYYLYSSGEKVIKKIDTTQESIKSLTAIMIGVQLHVFFVLFSNKTGKYLLVHDRIYNDIINNETIIDTISPDYTDVYAEWDNDDYIYVIYKRIEDNSYIMKRYNLSSNSYDDYNEQIPLQNLIGCSFHISNSKWALLVFTKQLTDKKSLIFLTRKLTDASATFSIPIEISNEISIPTEASIADDKKNIYITWKEFGFVMCKIYNYEREEWCPKKVLTVYNEKIFKAVYVEDSNLDEKINCNFIYGSIEKTPFSLIELHSLVSTPIEIEKGNTLSSATLYSLVVDRNNRISDIEGKNINLEKEIEILSQQLSVYKKEMISYKNQVDNWKEKYNSTLIKFNGQIETLYSEKNKISIEMSKITHDLNSIIDDKDGLINKLSSLINSYGIKEDLG